MIYRVNYGNGQVSGTFRTKREAMRHRTTDMAGTIEFRDPDTHEWFSCGLSLADALAYPLGAASATKKVNT